MYIIDTNALIYSVKQKVNLERFLKDEIVIPTSVIKELKKLSTEDSWANLAIKLTERFKKFNSTKYGDEGIIEAALKTGGYVITNDTELREKLKNLGIRYIGITDGSVRF